MCLRRAALQISTSALRRPSTDHVGHLTTSSTATWTVSHAFRSSKLPALHVSTATYACLPKVLYKLLLFNVMDAEAKDRQMPHIRITWAYCTYISEVTENGRYCIPQRYRPRAKPPACQGSINNAAEVKPRICTVSFQHSIYVLE